jgi:hypothetical protein
VNETLNREVRSPSAAPEGTPGAVTAVKPGEDQTRYRSREGAPAKQKWAEPGQITVRRAVRLEVGHPFVDQALRTLEMKTPVARRPVRNDGPKSHAYVARNICGTFRSHAPHAPSGEDRANAISLLSVDE